MRDPAEEDQVVTEAVEEKEAPEAAPEPACSAELAELVGRLADLAERFEERIANDRFKERQISQLHVPIVKPFSHARATETQRFSSQFSLCLRDSVAT